LAASAGEECGVSSGGEREGERGQERGGRTLDSFAALDLLGLHEQGLGLAFPAGAVVVVALLLEAGVLLLLVAALLGCGSCAAALCCEFGDELVAALLDGDVERGLVVVAVEGVRVGRRRGRGAAALGVGGGLVGVCHGVHGGCALELVEGCGDEGAGRRPDQVDDDDDHHRPLSLSLAPAESSHAPRSPDTAP